MAIFLPLLKQKGYLNDLHITVCNVGSRKLSIEDDYGSSGWGLFAPNLSIYGFDADLDACEAANADIAARQVSWTEKHLPYALSNEAKEATLYVTKHPMCSSLYPPNESLLSRFQSLPELVNLDFSVEVDLTTLDMVCQREGIEKIDFLQIDVQGADLDVLKGASEMLGRGILAVEIEVEFSPLYVGQPLFSDVDKFLRERGFSLFDLLISHCVRARSPVYSRQRPGQALWGEAYYFQDLLQSQCELNLVNYKKLFKLACIADVMNFSDYCLEILEFLTLNSSEVAEYNFADVIVAVLLQFPELVEQDLKSLPIVQNLTGYLSPALRADLSS